jgi:transcriptional regulator with XRE-family HTH domain
MKLRMASISYRVAVRTKAILKYQGLEQKDLAKRLKKSESEISKWLQGNHNFTVRSIEKIEKALGRRII